MPVVFTQSGNKFLAQLGLDEVEVGDILSPTFKPHVKIKRHANQCDLAISMPTDSTSLATFDGVNNIIGFRIDSNTRIEIYGKDPTAELVDGAMEFDVIIEKKPTGGKNTVELKLDSTTIDWKKILPLDVEFDQAKCEDRFPKATPPFTITPTSITDATGEVLKTRAENLINSYKGKAKQPKVDVKTVGINKNNELPINYHTPSRTHAHIKRGKARDADGVEVWIEDMNLAPDGTFTFTLPSDFVKNATYPIRQACGVDPAYTQDMDYFLTSAQLGSDGWNTDVDFNSIFGCPVSSVVEIIFGNQEAGVENSFGLRNTSSIATDRYVTLHEAEGGGQTHCRMFVQLDSSGLCDCYHSDVSDDDYFYLVGYWENVTFTDGMQAHTGMAAGWHGMSSYYGASASSRVMHIVMERGSEAAYDMGIRCVGSSLSRYIKVHEAESGGASYVDFMVKADANYQFEYYVEAGNAYNRLLELGYFGSEMDFVEKWNEVSSSSTTWLSIDLSAYLDQDGRMCDFMLVNKYDSGSVPMGVRDGDDTTTERYLTEHEAEGVTTEWTGFSMSAQSNSAGAVYIYQGSMDSYINIYLTGYFKPAGGSVTCTPTTASLTLTEYAPTVLAPRLVTPSIASLTLTEYAPRLILTVTPTTAALTITTYIPTIVNPQTVTPITASLTLTPYAPTVSTPVVATPTTATLTITSYIPTIGIAVKVTPTTATLTITSYAPTVLTPQTFIPTTAELTLTAYIPTVTVAEGAVTVIPETASLSLAVYAPKLDFKLTPVTATLIITTYTPTVLTPRLVTPTTVNLTLTGYAPKLEVVITPANGSLTITAYIPTVTVSADVVVIPITASLTLTGYAPTVETPVTVTPTTATLTITPYAPILKIMVTPSTASLTLTEYAPTVTAPCLVTPTTFALTLTVYAPTVNIAITVVPSTASLTLTPYAPTIITPVTATPITATLTITTYAPTVLAPRLVTPTTGELTITVYAPDVEATANWFITPSTATLILTIYTPAVFAGNNILITPITVALTLTGYAPIPYANLSYYPAEPFLARVPRRELTMGIPVEDVILRVPNRSLELVRR